MTKGITRRGALGGALAGAAAAEAKARVLPRGMLGGHAAVAPPVPIAVTLTPPSGTQFDNAAAGTLCSIAVTMSDGSAFAGSLSENGAFTQISGSNLVLSRALTSGDDGSYSILVTATQNSVSASNTFALTVAPPGAGVHFVTAVSVGGLQGSTGQFMGTRINLGTSNPSPPPANGSNYPLIVSALGRWVHGGNSGSHVLKIVDAITGVDVPGGSVTVNTAGKPANAFTYANLAAPVTLGVNQSFYIVSMESGGDQFGNAGTTVSHTGVAFPPNAVSFDGTNWNSGGPYEACYGPLDFVYTLASVVNVGSPLPVPDRTSYYNSFVLGGQGVSGVLTGTVTLDANWSYQDGRQPPVNSMVVQYMVDGQPGSPYITGPAGGTGMAPNFPWTFNSATLSNGTHHIVARFVDSNPGAGAVAAYRYRCYAAVYLVQNPAGTGVGSYSGAQVVPTGHATTPQPFGATSPIPDFVNYPGTPQQMNSHNRVPFSVKPGDPGYALNDPRYRQYSELYIEDMSAMKEQEFSDNPIFATTFNKGGVFIDYSSVDTAGGSAELMYPFAFASATRPGGRTNAFTTPLTTWIPAEGADATYGDDTGYLGIELRGSLVHLAWNGNETFLAGVTWDPAKLAFRNYDAQGHETEILGQCQTLGTIVAPTFSLGAFGGLNDLCYDPRDKKIVYVVNVIDSFIIKIDRNFSPPRCSRYAGQEDDAGYVNGNAVSAAKFAACSSIVMCDGSVAGFPIGTMLVADRDNSAIRRISPDVSDAARTVDTLCGNQVGKPTTGQLSTPAISDTWSPPGAVSFTTGNDSTGAYINFPFTIRFASNKSKLIWTELYTSTFRVIDLTAHTVTRIPNTKNIMAVGYNGWSWFDTDTLGVLGPVDDSVLAVGNGGINNMVYGRVSLDGSVVGGWIGDGTGRIGEGPGDQAGTVFAPMPVYAWAACFAKTRSHFIGGGFRYWGLYGARPKSPSDPHIDLGARIGINIDVFDKVSAQESGLWWNGTSMCFPLGSRPAWACLYGELGNGLLGSSIVPNFDDLAATYPTDGSFTAEVCGAGTLGRYFQLGGAGQVPRPELTGNDLRALCYYVRRVALSGTYPVAAEPGPFNPDNVVPLIGTVSAVRLSATSIRVSFQVTNKRTIAQAVAGSAAQQGTGFPYNVFSAIEPGFFAAGVTRTLDITGLPSGVTTYYSVIAKDVAGNASNAPAQSIA